MEVSEVKKADGVDEGEEYKRKGSICEEERMRD